MKSRSPKDLLRAKQQGVLSVFEDFGRRHPRAPWLDVLRRLGTTYGLVTRDLEPTDSAARRLLPKAKAAFHKAVASSGAVSSRLPRKVVPAPRSKRIAS